MFSFVAMDRILQQEVAANPEFRKRTAGRPLRSHATLLRDEELLEKLRSFGVAVDRPALRRLIDESLSAEEIAKPMTEAYVSKGNPEGVETDWIWICLTSLWARWFPDKPSFEMLDDKIQAGYELIASDITAGCRIWIEAWKDSLHIFDKGGIESIGEFDELFRGTQGLFNWIQDVEGKLWTAGFKDRRFFAERVALCEAGLLRFEADEYFVDQWRRALGESYFELGETAKADALFGEWLEADPGWGWGWIGWSDCYRFTHTEWADVKKVEELLRKGLSIPGLRAYEDVADRLSDLYEEQGRMDEAAALKRKPTPTIRRTTETLAGGQVVRERTIIDFGDEGLPLDEFPNAAKLRLGASARLPVSGRKIGRNEPCPCGSGKKFKKCCG